LSGGEPARPLLRDVTLVAVTSVAVGPTIEALEASMRQAEFAKAVLLTDMKPARLPVGIQWRPIDRLTSRADYSRFILRDLGAHIDTNHALCIQWDGFVLDGAFWDPSFLDFDYIGAVWPQFRDGHNVGNGGFSLRSKRLLELCRELPLNGSEPEDLVIGRWYRPELEARGIRYAPEAVARRFAYERTPPTGREFGFHGAFNLVRYLSAEQVLDLFQSLEASVLAQNERWELLWWALAHGQFRLAMTMLSKLRIKQS
jgi:hypothetical protein